jgi:hypothetical protein
MDRGSELLQFTRHKCPGLKPSAAERAIKGSGNLYRSLWIGQKLIERFRATPISTISFANFAARDEPLLRKTCSTPLGEREGILPTRKGAKMEAI